MKKFLSKIKKFFFFETVNIRLNQKGFFLKGEYYDYHFNNIEPYLRDRAVEIPVFKKIIEDYGKEDILEIGNTMNQHIQVDWDVVDKDEVAEGVINEDICVFKSEKKYGLIISISTIEHIGKYESGKGQDESIEKAFDNIKGLLKDKGRFVFSYPIGFNKELDNYIEKNNIHIDKVKTERNVIAFGKVKNE